MASDQEISEAIQTLLRDSNHNSYPSINSFISHLQSNLGFDLSHKLDFIQSQIRTFFNPPQLPTHNPTFSNPNSPQIPPNFPSQALNFRSSEKSKAPAREIRADDASALQIPKESAPTRTKRKGGPGGLNKLCAVSPELQVIVGQPALARTEIVKQLWAYIRKNNLQDPSNKRKIICNDELRVVFETDCTDMFKMNKLLAKHIISLEPKKESGQQSKKVKTYTESGPKSAESGPVVIISEALANFFGTTEREMPQSEVLKRVWEYIKVNHLGIGNHDPLNAIVILCDAKLQGLFGCESISALSIPEMLVRHHLFKRS